MATKAEKVGNALGIAGLISLPILAVLVSKPPKPPTGTNLYGVVIDFDTGVPISGASVNMLGYGVTYTDNDGYYSFQDISLGFYSITFEKEEYEKKVMTVDILEGNNEFNIQLVSYVGVGSFIYSNEYFEIRPWRELYPDAGDASGYVVFHCTIANISDEVGHRTVFFYYEMWRDGVITEQRLRKTIEIILDPGEIYQYIIDPRLSPAPNPPWEDAYGATMPLYTSADQHCYLIDSEDSGSDRMVVYGLF